MTDSSRAQSQAQRRAKLLTEAAALGPFFEVTVDPESARVPLQALYPGGDALSERVDATARALGTSDQRVAGSIFFQNLAARLWSPTLAVAAIAGLVLRLDPAETAPETTGLRCVSPSLVREELAEGLYRAVVEQHLEPLSEALPVSPTVLWGNAASSLVGSYGVMIGARPDLANPALLTTLLQIGKLAGTGHFDERQRFRRNSCCLYYRIPGGGLCGDCVLQKPPGQPRRRTT